MSNPLFFVVVFLRKKEEKQALVGLQRLSAAGGDRPSSELCGASLFLLSFFIGFFLLLFSSPFRACFGAVAFACLHPRLQWGGRGCDAPGGGGC